MTFRVGQKVVCMDATNTNTLGTPELVKGRIYTLASVYLGLVTLVEPTLPVMGFQRPAYIEFRESRFRPVVERKTDISIFTAMLTPKNVGVSA